MRIFIIALILTTSQLHAQEISQVAEFGSEIESEDFEMGAVNDIAVWENQIFVADGILSKIHHLEFSSAEIIRKNTIEVKEGQGPGELLELRLAGASEDYIAAVDVQEQKIVVMGHDGELIDEFFVDFRPMSIDFHDEELLLTGFWMTTGPELVYRYDVEGTKLGTMLARPDNWLEVAQTGNSGRIFPTEDYLFVSYPAPFLIEKYDWQENLIAEFEKPDQSAGIEEDEDGILVIESRITDIQKFGNYLLSVVTKENGYRFEWFDADLNQMHTLSSEEAGLDHISFARVLDDEHIIIRQLEPVPHLKVLNVNLDEH